MASFATDQDGRDAAVSAARFAALSLPERPRLAPWINAIDLGDARLQLRTTESAYTLTHPLLIRVFRAIEPLLDGRHTTDDIVAALDPEFLPTTALFLLKLLKGKGLLQPGSDGASGEEVELAPWAAQIDFLSHFVADAPAAQRALMAARAGIAGAGVLSQALSAALASIGISRCVSLPDPSTWRANSCVDAEALDVVIACADSPAFGFFDDVNRACLAADRQWLRVAVCGTAAELGPTVVPHQTACYACLDLRRRTHEPELDGYLAYRDRVGRESNRNPDGGSTPFCQMIAAQAALEVMRLVTGFAAPVTIGRYHELRALTPVVDSHDVLKVPRCPACDSRRSVPEAWDRGFALIGVEL